MHKNVTTKRATFTKAEREYVRGMVHNLSFQRLTDREIVDWLHEEKSIDLNRSTVSKLRNGAVKDAEGWYIGLRESGARYIAIYKERLDSLLSYQKKLHELINKNPSPELTVRAISELHRIELSLHTLMKELPGDITTSKDKVIAKQNNKDQENHQDWNEINGPKLKTFAEWYDNVRELGLMTEEINRTQYDAYVKEWNNGMFGPDASRKSIDFGPSKSIVFEQSEKAWTTVNNSDLDPKIEHSENSSEETRELQLSTEIGNDSGPELDEEIIEGPGQKHELGIHCTQCHRIYLNRESYNKHECMQMYDG
jgi:hypothetical protein